MCIEHVELGVLCLELIDELADGEADDIALQCSDLVAPFFVPPRQLLDVLSQQRRHSLHGVGLALFLVRRQTLEGLVRKQLAVLGRCQAESVRR